MSRLITGKVQAWANLILIANSALNSAVYCFREKFMEHGKKLKNSVMKTLTNNPTKSSTVSDTEGKINESVNSKQCMDKDIPL